MPVLESLEGDRLRPAWSCPSSTRTVSRWGDGGPKAAGRPSGSNAPANTVDRAERTTRFRPGPSRARGGLTSNPGKAGFRRLLRGRPASSCVRSQFQVGRSARIHREKGRGDRGADPPMRVEQDAEKKKRRVDHLPSSSPRVRHRRKGGAWSGRKKEGGQSLELYHLKTRSSRAAAWSTRRVVGAPELPPAPRPPFHAPHSRKERIPRRRDPPKAGRPHRPRFTSRRGERPRGGCRGHGGGPAGLGPSTRCEEHRAMTGRAGRWDRLRKLCPTSAAGDQDSGDALSPAEGTVARGFTASIS